MCRRTGVKGLRDLCGDINRLGGRDKNPLAAEYLRANMLGLLGTQVLVASRILQDEGAAHWRWRASRAFLEDVITMKMDEPTGENIRWFLRMSWKKYCFGIYCAHLVLKEQNYKQNIDEQSVDLIFPEEILKTGKRCITEGIMGHSPAQWAWWAGRMTLRDLRPKATGFVKSLGEILQPSSEITAFWRFFPLDVPVHILHEIVRHKEHPIESETLSGWWYDALRYKPEVITLLKNNARRRVINRVVRLLSRQQNDSISLYKWCDYLRGLPEGGSTDPRSGEWTALEIVRQIAVLVEGKEKTLGKNYIKESLQAKKNPLCIHPANFEIPNKWLSPLFWENGSEPTWNEWRGCVDNRNDSCSVVFVPKPERIADNRYTPLSNQNPLFSEINPVRGLGLLLYGLLRKSFDLPTIWNGPGHSDVLGLLPRLLLADMTCSAWTLGILQSCLQPRVTENIYLKRRKIGYPAADDTLHDPFLFFSATDVKSALEKCQKGLTDCQLSTFQHKARQLTPVSILQLTEPEWSKVFGGGNANE
jgi:hypothetical protein